MSQKYPLDDRRLDLLVEAAVAGLDADGQAELAALGEDELELESFELSAAAIASAYTPVGELPSGLRKRIADEAGRVLEEPREPRISNSVVSPATGIGWTAWSGWLAAAVAAVAALFGWWPESQPTPTPEPTLAERFETLREAAGASQWSFQPVVEEYGNAAGEVVWDDARQQGYMRFRGLAANDPSERQYQLWIVDPERDEQPVDGGVFDVSDGETIVPIDAKLPVERPTLFVITSEQPGGVVVSDGPHLLVAQAN